ncbi:DUF397 domain-containing protein [Streptomyces sp. MUM 203J]|uniref:DUF397 domain-containing protein n=1 Tax=Streptomyces sp. MUM 203J TaxID=2791990 RepID=UPI001F04691B|nr:DUF397 domain-containing protein [Streptomyces sp. MUM 203J]MCH0541909.1 DUF397 domain-containing protein [Streptomyces sp. MUM 203J]
MVTRAVLAVRTGRTNGSGPVRRKSSFSLGGEDEAQFEIAEQEGRILLRDADAPDETVVTTRESLRAFLQGIRAGEFDRLLG